VSQGRALAGALVAADDCVQLLNELKQRAKEQVTAYGLRGVYDGYGYVGGGVFFDSAMSRTGTPVPLAAGPVKAAGSAGASEQVAHSTTNNQEAGVDEPDLAKTDGELLVMVRQRPRGPVLRLIDVSGSEPVQAGKVWLDGMTDGQLFLDGDRAIVIGGAEPPPPHRYNSQGKSLSYGAMWSPSRDTQVAVVDISDPLHPEVEREITVPGSLVDARFLDGRVLTVTQSSPQLEFVYPRRGGHDARQRARLLNQQVIEGTTLEDWLPPVRSDDGTAWPSPCTSVYRPAKSAGAGSVSVTSIDPASDKPGKRATVVADTSVVYASTDALYLATNQWNDRGWLRRGVTSRVHTDLHEFDLADPDRPRYVGSGSVRGTVVDKYALSEQDGYLRVATTIGDASAPPGEGGKQGGRLSDNAVTVLKPQAGELTEVGRLSGLGRGERIYSVRFLGDIGYVVTFRETDPLFVLDLSDPTAPKSRGELKVTGYSSYLHPLGDGLLFGLGQGVDAHLRTRGVQTSVFDVSDLRNPTLRSRLNFGESWSSAEEDPHQFLWWPDERLVVVPVERYRGKTGDAVLHVGDDGSLDLRGWVDNHLGATHVWESAIERAIVVDDVLYTVSQGGVLASDLDSLETRTWLPFG
jgi:uncharacterized secreted protein with C-terminal beta-propeller domain